MKIKRAEITEDYETLKRIFHYPQELEGDLYTTKIYVQAPYRIVEESGELTISAKWLADKSESDRRKIISELESVERDIDDFIMLFGPEDQINNSSEKVIQALDAAGFIIHNQKDRKPLSIKEQKKTIIEVEKTIAPFEDITILQNVYKIDTDSNKSILDFCNQYGLLGLSINKPILNTIKENLMDFKREVEMIKNLVDNYWAINDTSATSFDKEKALAKENLLHFPWDYISHWYINKNIWLRFKKIEFAYFLNKQLSLVSPIISIDKTDGFLPAYSSPNLLGAIYFHLYKLAMRNLKLATCKYCGDKFVPRKSNAKYCSPKEFETRSPCGNSYNQMVYLARKQIEPGKKTIEEIARNKKRPIQEVRGWMEGYKSK